MVMELYCAPTEEVIMGSLSERIARTEDEPRPKKEKTTLTTMKIKGHKGCKEDIRNFFQNAGC